MNETTKPMEAVVYLRSASTVLNQDSTRTQLVAVKKYAKEHGINIIKIYKDNGNGESDLNRPALKQLLTDAGKNKFETVLVKDITRLARNILAFKKIDNILSRSDIQVLTTEKVPTEFRSPEQRFADELTIMVTELYKRTLSERIKAGIARKKAHARS